MRRKKTKPDDPEMVSGKTTKTEGPTSGEDWNTELAITPAWATEQMEHSWLGSLEFSEWTWTAWAKPANPTNKIQAKDDSRRAVLPEICRVRVKRDAPKHD